MARGRLTMGFRAAGGGAAALLALALGGCAALRAPLDALELPATPPPAGDWPRLVDGPAPAAEAAGPSPETGRALAEALGREALIGAAQAEALAGPVLPPAEAARLRRAAGR